MSRPVPTRLVSMLLTLAAVAAMLGATGEGARAATSHRAAGSRCQASVARSIRPASAVISSLGRTVAVVAVSRIRGGAIGTPPVTSKGKTLLGWDPHRRPGSGRGSVILDAHTWPDGSALGNAMLRALRRGSTILLRDKAGHGVCYRITKRHSYPRNRLPRGQMFRTGGKEQMVIVVCSGRRLGPGNWLRRTVWWGVPVGFPEVSAP